MLHFKFVKECFEDRGCFEYRHPVRREPHERNLWAGILRDFLYTKKFFSSTRKIKKIPSKMGTQPRSRPRIVPIFKGNFQKYEVFVGKRNEKFSIYPPPPFLTKIFLYIYRKLMHKNKICNFDKLNFFLFHQRQIQKHILKRKN